MHYISSVNLGTRMGYCTACACRVKVYPDRNHWRCSEAHKASKREHYKINGRGRKFNSTRTKIPGVNRAVRDQILAEITACEICGTNVNLCVDHCHNTGSIRGVLCHNCNVGLGHFRDKVQLLEAAITYLWENGDPR